MKIEKIFSNLISSESLNINNLETDPVKMFPFLVGNAFNMILQKENSLYTLTIKYSYAVQWLVYNIEDNNNNILQHDTYLTNFPLNLILCDELLGYGLFFDKNTLYFGKLINLWYNRQLNITSTDLLNDYIRGIETT